MLTAVYVCHNRWRNLHTYPFATSQDQFRFVSTEKVGRLTSCKGYFKYPMVAVMK